MKSCGRPLSPTEPIYTIPERPYGSGWSPGDEHRLYIWKGANLVGPSNTCGVTYSRDRGAWLCQACAVEAGWIW